jgi:hypothetical protein
MKSWRSSWKSLRRMLSILNNRAWYSRVFHWGVRALRLLFRMIRFDHFRLNATAGMDDPAETGKIYGWYTALYGSLLAQRKNIDVRLEPRFSEAVLEVNGSIGFTTSIYRVVAPVIVALVTFPYLRTWLVWRRFKKANAAAEPI